MVLARKLLATLLLGVLFFSPCAPVRANQRCPCGGESRILTYTHPPLRGQDVYELQLRLAQLGYYIGPITGIYDLATSRAVANFQKAHGLTPSGTVDPALGDLLMGQVKPSASLSSTGPPAGNLTILIDTRKLRLYLLVDGRVFREYPVAIGKYDTPSPVGEWKIIEKSFESGGAVGTRWLGLNVPWGNYGIHGTNRPWSIGWAASAGCFRMFNEDIEEMFPWIPIGTPVIVKGPHVPPKGPLKPGSRGPEVVTLQAALKARGFYVFGPADGDFGIMTRLAVTHFQLFQGLEPTGIAERETLFALGFHLPEEGE